MRILILHSRYSSGHASGENRVVVDETELLRRAGHRVWTWTPSVTSSSGLRLLATGAEAVWSLSAAAAVRSMVRQHRIDVVHCHNLFPRLSPSVLGAAASAGAAVVMTLHNYRLLCLPATLLRNGDVCEECLGKIPWRGVRYRCYRDSATQSAALATSLSIHRAIGSFDNVHLYLAVSAFVRSKYVQAGYDPGRIAVKPNFSWPIARQSHRGYFLFLGRLSVEKGLHTLIPYWGQVPATLLIVGEGPEEDRLRAMAVGEVVFRSTVTPSEASSLVAQARAVVLPSTGYEGLPRVAVEAFSASVPVLASRVGGLPELIDDGYSGMLLPPGKGGEWIAAAKQIMDERTRSRLAVGAHEAWRANLSPDIGIANLSSAYEEALSRVVGV